MERQELIRYLVEHGCVWWRPGSRHDIYWNPLTNLKQPVPRHVEIDDQLVKHIKRYLGLSS